MEEALSMALAPDTLNNAQMITEFDKQHLINVCSSELGGCRIMPLNEYLQMIGTK